jgi:hypothetical protein
MAPNPLHALVLLPLYFKRPETFDPAALVISSIAVDLEVIYAYLAGYPSPHLVMHSFVVAVTAYPVAIALFTYVLERSMTIRLGRVYGKLGLGGNVIYPFRNILVSSLIGGLSQMIIDVWTHPVSPFIFWPFAYLPANPLFLGAWSLAVDAIVVLVGAYSLTLWGKRWKRMTDRSEPEPRG